MDGLDWIRKYHSNGHEWGGNICRLVGAKSCFATSPVESKPRRDAWGEYDNPARSMGEAIYTPCPPIYSVVVGEYHLHPNKEGKQEVWYNPFSANDYQRAHSNTNITSYIFSDGGYWYLDELNQRAVRFK